MLKFQQTTKNYFPALITLYALASLCACSSLGIHQPGPFQLGETIVAKAIGDEGNRQVPIQPSDEFTVGEKEVIAYVPYKNLTGRHTLRWEWRSPNGEKYTATEAYPIRASTNSYIKEGGAYHKIAVKDAPASKMLGTWEVIVYLDNALFSRRLFKIKKLIPDIDFGDYYALVIGNNNYQHFKHLKSAVKDASAVARLLREKYNFKVTLLLNASRSETIQALDKLRNVLDTKSNLLIYYSGHGWLDKDADEGYWLPVDADSDTKVNWVSNHSLTTALKTITAKHALVVADSCYSGKLVRGINIRLKSADYFERMVAKKARTVLCSGGLEPVLDTGGKNGHSVFTAVFLNILETNQSVIEGAEIFTKLRRPVMLNADQTPEYSDIRKAGHDGGDFIFVRRN